MLLSLISSYNESLQVLCVSADFPVDKAVDVAEDHVLVRFDFLVRLNDTDRDSGRIDGALVQDRKLPDEFKVVLQVVG